MAFGVACALAALSLPAAAGLFSVQKALPDQPLAEPVQFRDFFQFPFSNAPSPFYAPRQQQQPQQPQESTRAPPPRKVETQPTSTVVVVGDLFAEWLGYGLEEALADTPEVGIVRKIKPYSGLVRYEAPKPEAPDWSQAIRDLLATEKPAAIVVMLGINDRLPLRERTPPKVPATPTAGQSAAPSSAPPAAPAGETAPSDAEQAASEAQRRAPGGIAEFHTDRWAELYDRRIDEMIAALKSKGVPVLWVGLPAVRGAKSTSDMSYLNDLFRARAEKAGITFVDVWDGFVDEKGNFAPQGPDFQGQIRRLRTLDGVYFTKPGAEKLARYVEHDLRRVMTSHVIPVALPGPEEQAPAKGNARPEIGPVVPLSVTATGESGDLLGTSSHQPPAPDPVVTRVLTHGEALAAPPGRADDFSWPRADTGASPDLSPEPLPAMPVARPAGKADSGKAEPGKNEPGKNSGAKGDAKKPAKSGQPVTRQPEARTQATPNPAPAQRPAPPRASLDGAPPRPPLPLGSSHD